MVQLKMLYLLLFRLALSIVLIAVVHPCQHGPLVRDSVFVRDIIGKLLVTLEGLMATIP
jgi:hypothetical protein